MKLVVNISVHFPQVGFFEIASRKYNKTYVVLLTNFDV